MKSPRKQELGGKRKSEISKREEQLRKEFKELIETLNLENTEKALLLDEYDENLRSHKEEAEVEGKEIEKIMHRLFYLPQLNAAQRMQLKSQVERYLQFRRKPN